jgi:hypothetical protein
MTLSVRFGGSTLYRPGIFSKINVSELEDTGANALDSMIIVGEALAGESQTIYRFTDYRDMQATFIEGNLADAALISFFAGKGEVDGIPVTGAKTVYCIKTNPSTQSTYTALDGAAGQSIKFSDILWGPRGNYSWIKFVAGVAAGLILTVGRDSDPDQGEITSPELGATGAEWLQIKYVGAAIAATVSVNTHLATPTLTTTTTGAVDDLAIDLTYFSTLENLASYIDSLAAYECTIIRTDRKSFDPKNMDKVVTQNIKGVFYKCKGMIYDIITWCNANASQYVEATYPAAKTMVQPAVVVKTYLTGGVLGITLSTGIDSAYVLAKKIPARTIASAFDRDISGPITIATINGKLSTHVTECNAITGTQERIGFAAIRTTTKALTIAAAAALNNEHVVLTCQDIYKEDVYGVQKWLGEWAKAVIDASIKAGTPVGTPLTNRYLNVYDITQLPTDWTPEDDADDMIQAGITIAQSYTGDGIIIVRGLTTWISTDNLGYRAIETVEAKDHLRRLLRTGLKSYLGNKSRGVVSVNRIKSKIDEILTLAADQNTEDFVLISGTDATGAIIPPYRNITVTMDQNVFRLRGDCTLITGIDFILNELYAKPSSAVL